MTALKRTALPLYHQLRELLREKIESGEWQPGYRLPTESELTVEFGVSRGTVRQAMQLLENQGLVERSQGRGTFVGRPKFANDFLSLALTAPPAKITLVHAKLVAPNASVATNLGLSEGEGAYELMRIVEAEGEILMLITSWLPSDMFPGLGDRDLQGIPIRRIVEGYYNLEGLQQHKELEVTLVDEVEAGYLQTNAGKPALLLTFVNRLRDGRRFEYRKMIVRGDRCKYYADLQVSEPLL
jgi:GntR family transcriptional regulator